MNKKQRIAELETLIVKYQKSYYDGEAEISDGEFDLLWDELKNLAPESPVIARIGSGSDNPSDNISDDASDASSRTVDGFPKTRHVIPMGSQEKAANPAEFIAWAQKNGMDIEKSANPEKSKKFLVQYKLDGASLELQYNKGELACAVTRGDGIIGDEITANAKRMQGVLTKLDLPFTGGVRGEVIMTHSIWRGSYADKANCRNAANGIMRRKDGQGCEDLLLICYDAAATNNDAFFPGELEKNKWLMLRGFRSMESQIFDNADEIIEYRQKVTEVRNELGFDIDGLVIKDMKTDMDDLRKARPEKQIAFKFELETAFSILRSVEWSESGATYTPIGIVDPVRLAGTTVQRANLNNPGMMRSLGLKIGRAVSIVKRGEIIPKIEGLAPPGALPDDPGIVTKEIEIPSLCTTCGTALVDAGTRLYCPNAACPKRLLHRLEKWIAVLDIRELGEKLIAQLFSKGRVRQISDLYTLTAQELAGYDRMGELSAAKVIRHINSPRNLSLAAFVAGFDYEGIAETTMDKIACAGFNTLAKLSCAAVEELADIFGIGTITAAIIADGLKETTQEMDAVLAAGIVTIAEPPAAETLKLSGVSFCFTGELSSMKRAQAEEKIKTLGGQAKSTVVKDLTYLVTNDPQSNSSKNKKARELGIPIINEEQFLELIGQDTGQETSDPKVAANGQGLLF